MKFFYIIFILLVGCVNEKTELTFDLDPASKMYGKKESPELEYEKNIVLMDRYAYDDVLTSIFGTTESMSFDFSDSSNPDSTLNKFDKLLMSINNPTKYIVKSNGNILGTGCDPYEKSPLCEIRKFSKHMSSVYAASPSGVNDVYNSMLKLKMCEGFARGLPHGELGHRDFSVFDEGGYHDLGIKNSTVNYTFSIFFHKYFVGEDITFNTSSLTYLPIFNIENITKVGKVFYPLNNDLISTSEILMEVDMYYPENFNDPEVNTENRREKWRYVFSFFCQSRFWEMI